MFKKIALLVGTVVCLFFLQSQSFGQTTTTFPSGSAIIDMGSSTPTVKNSLKPYGLIYALLKNNHVPVSYVVNTSKVKDGIDFVYNGKSYKGGTFVISGDYISSAVTTVLNNWSNQGVLIDYTTSSVTLSVTYKINFVPKWVMDKTNGAIAVGFLNAASIPASAYSFKDPSQLNGCDDIFVLPHADPTWNTHNNLYFWNKNNKGSIWAGCHAVSVLENISRDTTIGGVPTTLKMNFLSTNGLIPFTDHNSTTIPFTHFLPGDPIAQYYNKTDNAQLNGSENVYLPKVGSTWNAGAKKITTSPLQQDVPGLSPGEAMENIYGRAFDDATRGYIAYQAAHNIGGTSADQVAAQRIFFNFSLFTLNTKVPPIISTNLNGQPTILTNGITSTVISAGVTGTGTGFTYQWSASVGGTFSNPTSATTTFTPNIAGITSSTPCILTCVVTESCSRVSFDAQRIIVIPPPPDPVNPLNIIDIAKSLNDGCTAASITFNVFDGNVDANAGTRTLLSVTGLGNGSVITSTNGDITFTPAANFKGITTGTYKITNGISTSTSGNLTITVGDATKSPILTADAVTAIVDNVTVVNVLANDINKTGAADGGLLYIKDISTKPTNGYVFINSNGTLSYLSKKNYAGSASDNFQYLACNTDGYCSVGTVNVTLVLSGCSVGQYQTTTISTTGSLTGVVPSADAYIQSASTTTNTGANTTFLLNGNSAAERRPIMKFDVSTIPSTSAVTSANITFTTTAAFNPAANSNPFPVTIYGVTKAWTEGNNTASSDVTWLNFTTGNAWVIPGGDYTDLSGGVGNPQIANTFTNGVSNPIGTKIVTGDLKNIVQTWLTPANNKGLILLPKTAGVSVTLNITMGSRENATATNKPNLNVYYLTPPPCSTIPTTYIPVIYPDAVTTSSALSVTISPLTNDANYYGNTNKITAIGGLNPLSGTATVTPDGLQIIYTPSGSYVGVDSLRYTVTDQLYNTTNTGVVRITVTRVAPTIVSDAKTTNSNTATTIDVGTNDIDLQGTIGAPTIVTNPANGVVSVTGVGNIIAYTPTTNFTGTDVFTYRRFGQATDACSVALSGMATVTVTVSNQPPVAGPGTINTFACITGSVKITDIASDPESGTLSATIATGPSNGTAVAKADGTLAYTPTFAYTGLDAFTYTVTDPLGATSVAATVSITVSAGANPNIAPIAVNDADNTLVNQPVYTNVLANDSDPNNDPINISITALGLNGPLSGTITLMPNKLVKYTPNTNFTGSDTYQYKLTDTHGGCSANPSLSAIATVTITVKAIPTTLSGTVWNDVDQSATQSGVQTFTNIKTGIETGTNGSGSVYVYVTDNSNTIIDKTPVDIDGTYLLSSVPSGTFSLTLILSSEDQAIGNTLTSGSLPIGYNNSTPVTRALPVTTLADMGPYDWGIFINPTLAPGTIIGLANVCGATALAGTLTSTASATGGSVTATGYIYQWQSSITSALTGFSDVAGATATSYIPAAAITTTTYYKRKVSTNLNSAVYSNVVTVTLNPNPTVTVLPTAVVIQSGFTQVLSAAGALSYSWSPASNLSATNTATVISGPLTTTTAYIVTGTATTTGCVNTATVTVTVINPGIIGTDQSNCGSFTPTGFTSTSDASGGTITYQWQQSTDNTIFTNITGATGSTYSPNGISVTTYYRRVATSGGSSFNSNIVTATVKTIPTATAGNNGPVCVGTALNLSSSGGVSYNWSGPNSFTSTNQNPTIAGATLSATGTYTVIVTGSSGCTNTANTAVTVNGLPIVAVNPIVISSLSGIGNTLTGSGAATYSWSPATGLSTTNTAVVTAAPLITTAYTVTGTLTTTGCVNTATVTVTVINPGTIGTDQTNCGSFTPNSFTSTSDASGGTVTYQWQQSTDNTSFTNITGATGTTYSPGRISVTTYYRRTATYNGTLFTSNTVTATVKLLPIVTIAPTSITISSGLTQTLAASGANTYAWAPATGLSATNTAIVIAGPLSNTTYTVTGTATASGCSGTASTIVTVLPAGTLVPGVIGSNQNNCGPFTPAAFTSVIDAGGVNGITYQWQSSLVSAGTGFSNITGATATTYAPAAISATTYYRRVATSGGSSLNSNVITATINTAPVITIAPTSVSIVYGLSQTLTANGADVYAWTPATGLSAANTATVIASPLTSVVYAVTGTVTASGCTGTGSVNITVGAPPPLVPGTIGSPQTICSAVTPGAFTSTGATGGIAAVSYQWQQSTDNTSFTNIVGATSDTYGPGALTQTMYYRRGASTSVDPVVYTPSVPVTVLAKPVIIGAINGPCAMPRDTVKKFSVTAAANATNYVWTLPSTGGWSGTSVTNSINVKAGTTNGTISVTPYNGSCAGAPVNYAVAIIDYAKVTISGTPVSASGNNNNPIKVTIQLIDIVGNIIGCSGGAATLCTNSGAFTTVVDNGDGTYTSFLTSSANDVTICGAVAGVQISQTTKVTFTGPQGGIKSNGPILDFEIPKITFTATAGRAPFTVIYHSAKSAAGKNDTLTNVTSGTAYGVKLIPSTTLYTLVSVIDANGERRDNNFNRDTTTTIVKAPKVIITLNADKPKKEADSTWATRIVVHTKNIGDLDLTNSQARLNLKDVFPSPVTYVLDSVRVSGLTVVPNRNYDGITNTDLFSKLNSVKHDLYTAAPISNALGITDIAAPDGSGSIEMWNNMGDQRPDENTGVTVMDDGHSVYMFGPLSSLPVGVDATIILWLHIRPNGYTDPFVMQAVALGTGSTEGATALTTSLSNDNGDVNAHPEVTKSGDPLPAVINLFPIASIGAALSAGTPLLQLDGTYNVTLSYKVKNYGNLNLKNVQLSQNLLSSIGAPSTFKVISPVLSTGNLIPNPVFDAKLDTNMLLPLNSILGFKQEDVLSFTINITTNQLSSVYRLQAVASGYSEDLTATVTDLSTDGTNPDPDGNNIPSEKIITTIVINLPVPPLVPANIGIKTGPTTTVPAKGYCASVVGAEIIPVTSNSGGLDAYQFQWQSAADNIVFTDIIGAETDTYTTGLVKNSTYLRRGTISGSQIKYSNSVYLQIYPAPAIPVISGTGTIVVGKGNITLTSPLAAAYAWSTGATTRSIFVQDAGNYGLTITDNNGCTATATAYVITTLDPGKVADVQKILAKAPVLQQDGSFLLSFNILASNLRTEILDSVKLKDDLSKVFPASATFTVVDIKASGALISNISYDGKTQIDLLNNVSQLAASKTDSVQITIKVFPNGFAGTLNNVVNLTARSPYGTVAVISNDPVNNTNPGVRLPTKFVIPLIDIFIPSGFSPNHDGINDLFVITKPYNTTINLEIFNRWSNLVFKSPDYKNEWDGKGNQANRIMGEDLPDGTYYYVVLATDKSTGSVRKFAGYVTLKR